MYDETLIVNLHNRTTRGTWASHMDQAVLTYDSDGKGLHICAAPAVALLQTHADLEFIAASHQAIPALVEDLLRTRNDREHYRTLAAAADVEARRLQQIITEAGLDANLSPPA